MARVWQKNLWLNNKVLWIEHKTILRLRSLVVRKRATTKNALLARVVRLPNGPCWKVLSYWRATE